MPMILDESKIEGFENIAEQIQDQYPAAITEGLTVEHFFAPCKSSGTILAVLLFHQQYLFFLNQSSVWLTATEIGVMGIINSLCAFLDE